MEIELGNAIVILDEAHNIESTARDAGGLEVQYEDLKLASRQFGDMIKHEIHENTCRKLLDVSNECVCYSRSISAETQYSLTVATLVIAGDHVHDYSG